MRLRCHPTTAAFGLAIAPLAWAQFSGWSEGQVSAQICSWGLFRAHVLKEAVYLDGGKQWWVRGLQTGETELVVGNANPADYMFTLNFTKAFDLSKDNQTALFEPKEKVGGAGNNVAPNYIAGGALGNDAQFFLYGGLTLISGAYEDADANDVLEFQKYTYGVNDIRPGFVAEKLPEDVTRYVAYGASISAPSENKAWYFSGLRSNVSGIIYADKLAGNFPTDVSESMIQLEFDKDSQNTETWKNLTLPENVAGRASAEGVFVPVGENGVIVFVAGVTHPDFASISEESDNQAALKSDSEGFMKTIDIYDISSQKWYKQETQSSETVPGRAKGCAVMSYAKDRSSFNIYYYGGYSGADPREDYSDDVWILSLPSFTWVKAKPGNNEHARVGHRCVMPYPDQMMVLGGVTPEAGTDRYSCLKDGIIQLLNLTSLEWMKKYDPAVYGEYGVPEMVQKEIGGSFGGGATKTSPAGEWDDDNLKAIFEKAYQMDRIETHYPYQAANPTDRPDVGGGDGKGGGLPKWVAPTLGVVLGLVVITALAVIFLLWKRRKTLSATPTAESRIRAWIRGQPAPSKAMTLTTADDMGQVIDITQTVTPAAVIGRYNTPDDVKGHVEIHSHHIVELPGSSPTIELPSNPMTPTQIVSHGFSGQTPFSSDGLGTQHSSISRASAIASTSAGRSPVGDDPSTPNTPNLAESSRVTSGVSGISERDVKHLRQISEATVSDASEHGVGSGPAVVVEEKEKEAEMGITPDEQSMTVRSAPELPTPLSAGISPPSATDTRAAEDYLTAKSLPVSPSGGTLSPTRRSLFKESVEDMGEGNR